MKELNDLASLYQGMYEVDEAMEVTAADKKGNTPAWQGYKAGKKNVKTGKPLYKAAAHLKNEEVEVVDEGHGRPSNFDPNKATTNLAKGATNLTVGAVKALKKKKEQVNEEPITATALGVMAGKAALAGGAYAAGEAGVKKVLDKKKKQKKEEIEISPEVEKLIESGKFSDAEIAKIADIQEADIADILARLEKKRISKGGNPDDSPLPAMKKYHADKKKKAKK